MCNCIKGTEHESLTSDESDNGGGATSTSVGDDLPLSSEGGESFGQESSADEPQDLVEPNEGELSSLGEVESVPGFASEFLNQPGAPGGESVQVPPELEGIKSAEELEYGLPETVCGTDQRVRINPTTRVPWMWICQLIMTYKNGAKARGTGWLAGPRCVITAGHCVYNHGAGGWAKSIEVIPAMNGAARPYGTIVATAVRSVRGWVSGRSREFDYGAIILPKPTRLGSFGFANYNDNTLKNMIANTSGYPGDKTFGTQWFAAGKISSVRPRQLLYMIDTAPGQSGMPVWRTTGGKRYAVGIHAYGGCPNGATRIVKPVFDNIKAWRAL